MKSRETPGISTQFQQVQTGYSWCCRPQDCSRGGTNSDRKA